MTKVLSTRCKIEAEWMERIGLTLTAAAGVALTTGVIAAFIYFMIALASIVSGRPGNPQSAPPGAETPVAAQAATIAYSNL
jgi:hypothetical protein